MPPVRQHRHDPVAGELVHRAADTANYHCRTIDQIVMISRSRLPTAAAMSIE
jgi:hypothetical protein